jgi:phosphatidate cytidylyltransferase
MKSLPQRIISAAIAIIVIFVVNYFFETPGIIALGFLLCTGGAFEYQRIAFQPQQLPKTLRAWFLVVCISLMLLTVFSNWYLLSMWGVLVTTYIVGALWILRNKIENERLLTALSLSALGFIYCSLLPTFALNLLNLQDGMAWFLLLCGIVFAGDVFAYFGGIWFGEKKIMPNLSPNKTRAGSISGLIGSTLAALTVGYLGLKSVPLYGLIPVALFGGFTAQNGDLFESLLKRVASVKDSGQFMPGHGGVLDRLDGLYFAAPLVYAAALFFTE